LLAAGRTDYINDLGPSKIAYRYAYNPESGMIEEVPTA